MLPDKANEICTSLEAPPSTMDKCEAPIHSSPRCEQDRFTLLKQSIGTAVYYVAPTKLPLRGRAWSPPEHCVLKFVWLS